jgi:hypothetical protein
VIIARKALDHIERVEHIYQIVLKSGVTPPRKETDAKRKKLFSIV